jgi:hypothetical protein
MAEKELTDDERNARLDTILDGLAAFFIGRAELRIDRRIMTSFATPTTIVEFKLKD